MEEFVAYLEGKRIDSIAFRENEEELFKKWETMFLQVSPKSFTAQKLYLINNIRRVYRLPEDRVVKKKK